FVRLSGETDASLPMSLASKPPWQRAIILISGALMNLIYPILVFTILSMVPHNVPIENSGQIQIVEVIPGSPADQGGVAAQDKILFVNEAPISSPSSLKDVLNLNQDQSSKWTIERSQKRIDLEVIPQYDNSYEQWVSGIRITTVNQQYTRKSNPPWVAVYDGFAETIKLLNALQYEVRNMVTQDVQNQITGPVGIAQITGEVAKQAGFQGVVILSIIISINLAILNILPIPMLDGGRLLFVMIEMVRGGKQLSRQRENFFHAMGFVFLITLIIIVTMKDIQKILLGESFLGG
ncbi:MAG: site-2 protease family protein, partial [SAR202 cluster bacterium]|nr:site-2 protease family protein [SAR202 cluster bacterium]